MDYKYTPPRFVIDLGLPPPPPEIVPWETSAVQAEIAAILQVDLFLAYLDMEDMPWASRPLSYWLYRYVRAKHPTWAFRLGALPGVSALIGIVFSDAPNEPPAGFCVGCRLPAWVQTLVTAGGPESEEENFTTQECAQWIREVRG